MARYSATVKEVIDGDTFKTVKGNEIRLARVDAPEKGEQGYAKAKSDLENLIGGKNITYEPVSSSYGRIVAEVWVNGKNVNDAMIALGWK